ncbi:MAG: L,D-transpeptidase family protein [Bacteriovorax sp.]|nr:L,D-transpeptidase family protein [Bacteriovorax sp.]
MKTGLLALFLSITATNVFASSEVKYLHVIKSERKLELIGSNDKVIKTYKVMLGRTPMGPKSEEGDNKTPEGTYTLDIKNDDSDFHRSFHISYPNLKQKMKAKMRGVSPGGDIMLHGLPNNFGEMISYLEKIGLGSLSDDLIRLGLKNFDWTNGCIAVSDTEIEEIYGMVDVPIKIVIEP